MKLTEWKYWPVAKEGGYWFILFMVGSVLYIIVR